MAKRSVLGMANCPHCQTEYEPASGQTGCSACGGLLTETEASLADHAPENDQVESEPINANNKVIGVGEGQTAGRDINISQTTVYCTVGAEELLGSRRKYQCLNCGRSPVCEVHFDASKKFCVECVGELVTGKTVPCGFCGDRIPVDQAFTCPKCLKICGPDHKSATKELCVECNARWDQVVQDIENGKVGIGPGGTVVTREDVAVRNGVIRDKEGHLVATIKKQTWYAKRRQWHTVKHQ